MKTILVTGAAGFIGSHLCERLLNDGNKVIGIDDLSLGNMQNLSGILANRNFVFFKKDILRSSQITGFYKPYEKCNEIDTVFHFAANSDISKCDSKVEMEKTFMTTYKILCNCRNYNIKKIVFPSSGAIYGLVREPVKEDHGPLLPISHYAAAKLASEAFISSFCSMHDIQAWICRLPNVVGEHATHGAILDFIKRIKSFPEELTVLGDGNQTKPYMYVKDCIDAILHIWKNANEEVNYYNIAGEGQTSVKEIAGMVVTEMKTDTKIVYAGGDRGWKGDSPYYKPQIKKLIALGYVPSMDSNEAVKLAIKKILDETKT